MKKAPKWDKESPSQKNGEGDVAPAIIIGAILVSITVFGGLVLTRDKGKSESRSTYSISSESDRDVTDRILLNNSQALADTSKSMDTARLIDACAKMCTEQRDEKNRTASFDSQGVSCNCEKGAEAERDKVENITFSGMDIRMESGSSLMDASMRPLRENVPSRNDCCIPLTVTPTAPVRAPSK